MRAIFAAASAASAPASGLLQFWEQSGRKGSRHSCSDALDTVLTAFADCCLPAQRWWGTQELIDKLDALAGGDTFRRLTDAHLRSKRFPALADAYDRLGLEAIDDRHVELRGNAPARNLRRAIMGSD